MTHWREVLESDWLFAGDIWPDGKNKDVTVLVEKWERGKLVGVGGRTSTKPVLTFRGKKKKLALNATNCRVIESLYGGLMDAWVGQSLILFRGTTRDPDTGATIGCIRVRPERPGAAPSTGPQEPPRGS